VGLLQLAEGSQFGPPQGMDRRHPLFQAPDMQHRGFQTQHILSEVHRFGHAQAMPIHQQEQGRTAVPIAAALPRRPNEVVHFDWGQVFAGAALAIPAFLRRGLGRK
jgi:hypothetical protein